MRVIGRGQVLLAADHGAVTTASLYLNAICSPPAWRQGTSRNEFDPSRIVAPGAADKSESAMDILAGMLAYLAGIGVIFGGLALSLLLFTATPKQPLTPQSPVATAMRVAPNAAAKTPDAQANAKHPDSRSEKLGKYAPPAARPPDAARLATVARDINRDKHRKTATPAENARRLAQEERARRWAYQRDANGSTFAGRFLGYAD